MLRVQTWFLLVLCTGNLDAWWFLKQKPTAESPALALTPAGTTGATTTANKTQEMQEEEEEEDDDLSGVGEEILHVADGIRNVLDMWEAILTARTANGGLTEKVERANPNTTGNAVKLKGERAEEGSGSGSTAGFESDVDPVKVSKGLPRNVSAIIGDVFEINRTVEGVSGSPPTPPARRINASDPPCLLVPPDWPICSGKWPKSLTLPNFFNHTSVEEVGAVLREWAWLTRKGCHHSAEWFLCLLLAPRCPSPNALPCRSFCQVLQDSCWASLENGRLPVECHLLPEGAQEDGGPACVSVSNWKGNSGGLECIRFGNTF